MDACFYYRFVVHTVYTITNQGNGKYYVGRTKAPLRYRLRQHFYDARSVKKPLLMPLHRVMRKESVENFTISPVAECATVQEAIEREKLFIWVLRAMDPNLGYNAHPGGNGPRHQRRYPLSSETREQMSESAKARCARNVKTHCVN